MKKQFVLGSFLALSAALYGQNEVSYNVNSSPIVGVNNTAFGLLVLGLNTTGNHNTGTGNFSLSSNTTGIYNSAHGMNALNANTTGNFNAASGSTALYLNQTGSNNTANGFESMRQNVSGNNNSVNGYWSLYSNLTGNNNTANGNRALYNNTSGSNNTADGTRALFTNVTGSNNTALGRGADVSTGALVNTTAIGANAIVTQSNKMILGNNVVRVGIGLSGNVAGPANKLEINENALAAATTANPFIVGSFGASGLRFRKMTSSTPITPNGIAGVNNQKVLSVTSAGDVVLVSAAAGFGNFCGSAQNPLTNSWEVPMAGFNVSYTMPATSPSQFIIGNTNCTPGFQARFLVNNDFYTTGSIVNSVVTNTATVVAGRFNSQNLGTGNCTAINARATASNTAANAIGVNANSTGNLSYDNLGVNAPTANGSHASIGLNADINTSTSPINQGHNTEIFNCTATSFNSGANLTVSTIGNTNYGVFAYAAGANFNAAVYGSTPLLSTSTSGTDWAGYFNGSVISTGGAVFVSDKRLKKDIATLNNSLDIIKKLNPVTYSFDQENHKNINLAQGKQYGFISQEVKEILPELTAPFIVPAVLDAEGNEVTAKEEFLGLNYQGFTALMIDAIKTQQGTIETQQKQIDELKTLVQSLVTGNSLNGTEKNNFQEVSLSDKNAIVLNQNVPNPFAESTVITYNIPTDFVKAQIIFTTIDGKVIRTVDVKEKGQGTLNVFANDLSNGLYTYSLVVDGKVIDSKKMVKE